MISAVESTPAPHATMTGARQSGSARLEGARARAAAWCSIGVLPSNFWMDRSWGLQRDHRIDQAVRPRLDLADPVVLAGRPIAKDEARRLCAIGDDRDGIERLPVGDGDRRIEDERTVGQSVGWGKSVADRDELGSRRNVK